MYKSGQNVSDYVAELKSISQYWEFNDHFCHLKGHITPACHKKARQKCKNAHWRPDHRAYHMEDNPKPQDTHNSSSDNYSVYSMYRFKPSATRVPPVMTNLNVNGENLSFEVDTGAAIPRLQYLSSVRLHMNQCGPYIQ